MDNSWGLIFNTIIANNGMSQGIRICLDVLCVNQGKILSNVHFLSNNGFYKQYDRILIAIISTTLVIILC